MNKQKVLFLGSKPIGYSCLEHLIGCQNEEGIEIIGVLTNDNNRFNAALSVKELARQHRIPLYENLDQMPSSDFLISVQYHEILKAEHIRKAQQVAINLHMAPLPEYRGCNQFSFALLDQKKVFGTTLHVMDEGIDHGDILFEKRFPIPENCWVEELYDLTYRASLELFREKISEIFRNNYTRTSQQSLIAERGSSLHYRKEMQHIKQIDLSWEEEKILRHLRATSMPGFEPPFTVIENQKIYLSREWPKK